MPWTYSQTSRRLYSPTNSVVGVGYSGRDRGYNSHAAQAEQDIGPIPCGTYAIGPSFRHAQAGPVTMRLAPTAETEVFERSGFMIHGDSAEHAMHPKAENSASHGCLILARQMREEIDASRDRTLIVTI